MQWMQRMQSRVAMGKRLMVLALYAKCLEAVAVVPEVDAVEAAAEAHEDLRMGDDASCVVKKGIGLATARLVQARIAAAGAA